jgi:uncharacterized iron-regulated membrane protein
MRQIFVRLHRWLGLATAVFLIVAGLTGSVIAFNHELDEWLNPELFHVDEDGVRMPSLELAARVEELEPRLRVTYVPLEVERGHALVLGVIGRPDPTLGALYDLGYDEVFVNPVTGARLGERLWGACCFERKQLLPFIYSIHYSLHLPELWGLWLMGIVAAAWAIDSFVGFYLTLPPRNRVARHLPGPPARQPRWGGVTGRLRRWKPAWKIKFGASRYRINFDLHRAAGLWCWALLLMLAISAVSLNLHFELFRPLLSRLTTVTPSPFDPSLATAPVDPTVSFATVVATAAQVGVERGWQPPFDVFYSAEFGLYGVGFGDHHLPGIGVPYLYFDRHGAVTGQTVPGAGTVGDTVLQVMFPLHSGQIIGLPGRILISLTGLVVATLSVTGVIIWARKRKGRLARRDVMAPNAVADESTPGWRWPGRRGSAA